MTVPNWAINMNRPVQPNPTKKINKMNITHNSGCNLFSMAAKCEQRLAYTSGARLEICTMRINIQYCTVLL